MIYNTVIIGGGPAGSTTGFTLMNNDNRDVILFEREHPRSICAGGISKWMYDKIGGDIPSSIILNEIKKIYVHSPNDSLCIDADNFDNGSVLGYIIDRREFDDWLLGRASRSGVKVRLDSNVISIDKQNTLFRIKTREDVYHAMNLVRATGGRSASDNAIAYQEHWEIMTSEFLPMDEFTSDSIHIYFNPSLIPDGYVWIFPTSSYTAKVGTGMFPTLGNPRVVLQRWKKLMGIAGIRVFWREGDIIGTGNPIYSSYPNEFFVGDAGNYASSFNGGGIWTAFLSGRLAGEVISHNGSSSEYYKLCKHEFGGWLQKHRLAHDFFSRLDNKGFDSVVGYMKDFEFRNTNPVTEVPRVMFHLAKYFPDFLGKVKFFKRRRH